MEDMVGIVGSVGRAGLVGRVGRVETNKHMFRSYLRFLYKILGPLDYMFVLF